MKGAVNNSTCTDQRTPLIDVVQTIRFGQIFVPLHGPRAANERAIEPGRRTFNRRVIGDQIRGAGNEHAEPIDRQDTEEASHDETHQIAVAL